MSYVTYQEAKEIGDRFLKLLADRGITPPNRTDAEHEMLALTDLLEIWRDPARIKDTAGEADIIRCAAGIHDLAAKVLSAESRPEFASFADHLKMVASAKEFTTIAQNTKGDVRDQIANKMAELYVGALAIHCGKSVRLDSPDRSKGDNPDVILDYEGRTWTLAVKTLASARNGQSIFDNIKRAAQQIDASAAEIGMVVINAKNVIKHEQFWKQTFAGIDEARQALQAELQALSDLASLDRPQSEWNEVFSGKAVPPVIFLGQSVTYLPVGDAFRAPTPIKMILADACNRPPDAIGTALVQCLTHWMQTILRGNPGSPPS